MLYLCGLLDSFEVVSKRTNAIGINNLPPITDYIGGIFIFSMEVSIFRNVKETSNPFNKHILYVLERIKVGKSKNIIDKIRSGDLSLKLSLPGVCFNGVFKNRSVSGLVGKSGFIILDFDKFENTQDAIDFKTQMSKDAFTFACWISPSGLGVKVLFKIPIDDKSHKGYFDAIKTSYDSKYFDESGSDISRFCFESYDPDIYINENCEIWTDYEFEDIEFIGCINPVLAIKSDNRIIQNLLTWWGNKFGMVEGQKNTNLFKLASAFNEFGINQIECENTLMQFDEGGKETEILNLIKSAYKKVHLHGTKFFEDKQTQSKVEKLIRSGKKDKDILNLIKDVDINELENCVNIVRDNIAVIDFWYYDKNGRVKLSPHKYKFWLEQNNFFKYFPTDTSTYTFIKVENNLIDETNESRIKDFVLDYLLSREDVGFSPYDFMAENPKYFDAKFLSFLKSSDVNFKEDEQEKCYIYYQNKVVEITKESKKEIDYIDIDGYVWRRQIVSRDYIDFDHHESEFRKFLWLVSGQNVERYNSFKSVIGYLLHSFKTSANNKAIIFNDETVSENPNGGSGKGLFWNALNKMKKVSSIDGKTFEFTKSFPYQTVSADTQILVFDDVKKNFSFESLFSLITEGITLEYKGQDAIKLPVQKSPKILITTNYTIGGVGGSFERRKFEVEMSAYFSASHTPLDEFGHLLFDEWSETEWLKFDNFMINCVQFYLKNGLIKHEFNNLELRKFIKNTSFEFYEWSSDPDNLPIGSRESKNIYFERFLNDYQDFKKWLSQKKFKQWLEYYAKYSGLEYKDGNSGGDRWFRLEKINSPIEIEDAPF